MRLEKLPKKVLHGQVFIKKAPKVEKTASGIYLSPEEGAYNKMAIGEVVLVAEDVKVKVGDKVLYNNYTGSDFQIGEDEILLMQEKGNVHAIL